MGKVIELLDLRFIPTTEAPVQVHPTNAALKLLESQQQGPTIRYSDVDGTCTFAGAIDAMIWAEK